MSAPSEVLSRAADLIRDTAAAATPGPWEFGERCVWEYAIGLPVVGDGENGEGGIQHEPDARWIALLSPAVAPAIEAWLRYAAEMWDYPDQPSSDVNALAFARVILAEVGSR